MSRLSRFRGAPFAISAPAPDEVVTPAQRLKRVGLHARLLYELVTQDIGHYRELCSELGVVPDQSDRNDAVLTASHEVDGWTVRWLLAEQDGAYVPRGVTVESAGRATPSGGITADLLRELSPAAAVAAVGASASDRDERRSESVILRWVEDQRQAHGPMSSSSKRGRPRTPESEMARVAETYLRESPMGRGITERVASELGLPIDTARDRIRMARSRGFLTPTKQGRRGGLAGPALLEYRARTARQEGN